MWKKIRILILLMVLLVVAVNAWRDQNQDWNKPIVVLLHPINADRQVATQHYIEQLSSTALLDAQDYLKAMSGQYRRPIVLYFKMGRKLKKLPPKIPEHAGMLQTILWSLKFRFYAWQQQQRGDGVASVTLFLNYYDPQHAKQLKHSTALENGRIGSVNLFASEKQTPQNNIVLVHELLHAFGASDKYNLANGQPLYPIGYANPQQQPLFPQAKAELMAGHIPLSTQSSKMPEALAQTMIGQMTAIELGWIK